MALSFQDAQATFQQQLAQAGYNPQQIQQYLPFLMGAFQNPESADALRAVGQLPQGVYQVWNGLAGQASAQRREQLATPLPVGAPAPGAPTANDPSADAVGMQRVWGYGPSNDAEGNEVNAWGNYYQYPDGSLHGNPPPANVAALQAQRAQQEQARNQQQNGLMDWNNKILAATAPQVMGDRPRYQQLSDGVIFDNALGQSYRPGEAPAEALQQLGLPGQLPAPKPIATPTVALGAPAPGNPNVNWTGDVAPTGAPAAGQPPAGNNTPTDLNANVGGQNFPGGVQPPPAVGQPPPPGSLGSAENPITFNTPPGGWQPNAPAPAQPGVGNGTGAGAGTGAGPGGATAPTVAPLPSLAIPRLQQPDLPPDAVNWTPQEIYMYMSGALRRPAAPTNLNANVGGQNYPGGQALPPMAPAAGSDVQAMRGGMQTPTVQDRSLAPQVFLQTPTANGQPMATPTTTGGGRMRVLSAIQTPTVDRGPQFSVSAGEGDEDIPPDPGPGPNGLPQVWNPNTKKWEEMPAPNASGGTSTTATGGTTNPVPGGNPVPAGTTTTTTTSNPTGGNGPKVGDTKTVDVGGGFVQDQVFDPGDPLQGIPPHWKNNGTARSATAPQQHPTNTTAPRPPEIPGLIVTQHTDEYGNTTYSYANDPNHKTPLTPEQLANLNASTANLNAQTANIGAGAAATVAAAGISAATQQKIAELQDKRERDKATSDQMQAAADRALKSDLAYRDIARNDTLAANTVAQTTGQLTGYTNGAPTLAREQQVSDTELNQAKFLADRANQAAQIALATGNQAEAKRQFDISQALKTQGQGFDQALQIAQFDEQRRQNPASFLDIAYAQRGMEGRAPGLPSSGLQATTPYTALPGMATPGLQPASAPAGSATNPISFPTPPGGWQPNQGAPALAMGGTMPQMGMATPTTAPAGYAQTMQASQDAYTAQVQAQQGMAPQPGDRPFAAGGFDQGPQAMQTPTVDRYAAQMPMGNGNQAQPGQARMMALDTPTTGGFDFGAGAAPSATQAPTVSDKPFTTPQPLSMDEINRSGAQLPGLAAAFGGQDQSGGVRTAGNVPYLSAQKLGQLSGTERTGLEAELKATGNSAPDYFDQVKRLSATGDGPSTFSTRQAAPRRVYSGV